VRSGGASPPDALPCCVKGSCGACTRTRWRATKISCARACHQGDASRSISRGIATQPGSGAGYGSIRGQGNPVPRELTTFSASRVSGRERVSPDRLRARYTCHLPARRRRGKFWTENTQYTIFSSQTRGLRPTTRAPSGLSKCAAALLQPRAAGYCCCCAVAVVMVLRLKLLLRLLLLLLWLGLRLRCARAAAERTGRWTRAHGPPTR
jgi:hypothetical protein